MSTSSVQTGAEKKEEVKKKVKLVPGPTLSRLAGVVFWVTLDCLVPTSLLVSEHGNSVEEFISMELVSFDTRTGGFDLCLLAILRSVIGTSMAGAVHAVDVLMAPSKHVVRERDAAIRLPGCSAPNRAHHACPSGHARPSMFHVC